MTTYNWKEALALSVGSLLNQTVLPDEIIIADDGSKDDTKEVIEQLKSTTKVPIIHVWQEDCGYRKTSILNKAIAQARYDYLVQIDGDVVTERHFIQDHLELAEENCFICGSRVKLSPATTKRVLAKGKAEIGLSDMPLGFIFNGLRSKILRRFLADKYGKRIEYLRGCNMSFWKKDIIAVNGYNEDIIEWGHEDIEIGFRLASSGVRKKFLKLGGIVYHLDHNEFSRKNADSNLRKAKHTKEEGLKSCTNGISKYL